MKALAQKMVRRIAAEWREARRWTPYRASIRAYYGFDHLPTRDDQVSGGLVKCLDLAERFPSSPERPNLLYLVSSVLPDRRELLARAAQRAGGRVVLNQNGVAYPAWAGLGWKQQNAPNQWIHARADAIIYQSEFCRRCALHFLGAPRSAGEVLYNPVDTGVFTPSAHRERSTSGPLLLVAGSHHDDYRVRGAVEALARLRRAGIDARLRVAGRLLWTEHAEQEALQWVRRAGVDGAVEFIGPYTQREAPDLFRSAQVLVHLKVQDACPRLVVEAMACGLPVVYSRSGGTPELVGPDAGAGVAGGEDFERIAPPEVDSIVEALQQVLTHRETMAQAARLRAVQQFSVGPWLDAHARIFDRLR